MASKLFPVRGEAYSFPAYLEPRGSADTFQANPTLEEGDVKIVIDGSPPANIDDLPVVDADFTKKVDVTVTALEMTGSQVDILFSDADGDEWKDQAYTIFPAAVGVDALARTGADSDTLETLSDQLDAIVADTNELQTDDVPGLITALIGADSDTLETLSDQMDGVLVNVQAATATIAAGSSISFVRGTTWERQITGLGDIQAYDTIYFTAKGSVDLPDSAAYLQLYNDTSGLLRFNGAAPAATSNGKITINNAVTGIVTIRVEVAETEDAPLIENYVWDIKGIDDNGDKIPLSGHGDFIVTGDVTRAITSP
jgi:hypothetical protein